MLTLLFVIIPVILTCLTIWLGIIWILSMKKFYKVCNSAYNIAGLIIIGLGFTVGLTGLTLTLIEVLS